MITSIPAWLAKYYLLRYYNGYPLIDHLLIQIKLCKPSEDYIYVKVIPRSNKV